VLLNLWSKWYSKVKKHGCVMYLFWRCSIYDIEAPRAACHLKWLCHIVLPWFSPEPKFKPELWWTWPKSSSKFKNCLKRMTVFIGKYLSFQQTSRNSEVFGHMTRMPGLPCMGTAESATKISNVWHHQVALIPAPSIFIAICRTPRAFLGLFQQNNCSSLNIL
jgi:hypothetical protein